MSRETFLLVDPNHSLVDFAILSARLSQPFADRAALLHAIGEDGWAMAASTWRVLMGRDPALTATFKRTFTLERERQRGPRELQSPVLPVGSEVRACEAPAPNPDETQLAPVHPLVPALPFAPGQYRPEPLPIVPRDSGLAPDATMAPAPNPDETLPFFNRHPSNFRKP